MNMFDIIIDKSPKQKLRRIALMREELKPLGYSIVSTVYLAGLIVQAKRRPALEEA